MKRRKKKSYLCVIAVLLVIGISFFIPKNFVKAATNTCTVAYISNEGTMLPSQICAQGSYLAALPIPSRDGYVFGGWFLNEALTQKISTPYYIPVETYDSVLVLFAKWQKVSVRSMTAIYKTPTAVIGSLLDKEKITLTVVYENGKVEIVKEFIISDLKVSNLGANLFTITYENATTTFVVMGIQEQFYNVTFISNGGTLVNTITGVRTGDTISMPAEPTKSGYTFAGWYQDGAFKTPFTKETIIQSNMIVYAKWTKDVVEEEKTEYELNTTQMNLKVDASDSVFIITYDPDLENYVTYTSSKRSVASVDMDGIVTAHKNGTATISVTAPDGSVLKCKVQVGPKNLIKKISASVSSKRIKKGKSYTLKTKITPSNATIKKLSYTSSNTKVASVNSSGKITAKNKGTCYITVKTTDGSAIMKKIKITVY